MKKNLRLSNGDAFLEADAVVEEDSSLPSHGDVRLVLRVRSNGFVGESAAWVGRDELAKFLRDAKALGGLSRGEATLKSMSPNQLQLTLRAVDARGHFAAEGSVGRHIYTENSGFWHSVSFGFELDHAQLDAVAAWASSNVA